jgi:hypothetical protein
MMRGRASARLLEGHDWTRACVVSLAEAKEMVTMARTAVLPENLDAAPADAGPAPRKHPTVKERAARGKAARAAVPRASHGEFTPSATRRDPIDVIEAQSATRVPEFVPIRYGRMIESPFRFYRGAAAIMAMDLAGTPRSGITAQLCGDAHLLNFRLLGSAEQGVEKGGRTARSTGSGISACTIPGQ